MNNEREAKKGTEKERKTGYGERKRKLRREGRWEFGEEEETEQTCEQEKQEKQQEKQQKNKEQEEGEEGERK